MQPAAIVAVAAAQGQRNAIVEAAGLLGDEYWLAAMARDSMLYSTRLGAREALGLLLSRVSRSSLVALASRNGVCTATSLFLKNGLYSLVAACSLARLGREAVVTGQPPSPSRRSPEAVLYAYISRLVGDGVGLERLVAKIAARGGGLGAGILAWSLGARPRILLAVGDKASLCTRHLGRAVVAYIGKGAGSCRSSVVAVAELVAGTVRLVYRDIDRVLYS